MTCLAAIFLHRLLEVLFRGIASETGSVGVKSHDLPAFVHQHEEIKRANLPDVPGRILNGRWVGIAHYGPSNREVREKCDVVGQHRLALMTEILKRRDRIV